MSDLKLKFEGREFFLGSGIVTLGRTPDNSVSFPEDANVSRYHAEIERRGEEYCLIDLNSSNGTALNGQPVLGEIYLAEGDVITLGGSAEIKVAPAVEERQTEPDASAPPVGSIDDPEPVTTEEDTNNGAAAVAPEAQGSNRGMLMVAGGVFGLAVIIGIGAVAFYLMQDSSCGATATVISPEQGDSISKVTEILVSVKDDGCVESVAFSLDGLEFARVSDSPYSTEIDPKDFPDLADGFDHPLSVTLIDAEGNRIPQAGTILLAFETRAIAKPEIDVPTTPGRPQQPSTPKPTGPSLIEINEMSNRLLAQFPSSTKYNVSNRQFLQEIQRRTEEFSQGGHYEKAARYRDAINVAYVREQNLDAPLGYLLAMSRSKFDPAKSGNTVGLWQMSEEFVTSNSYNGPCGNEPITDASQNCAAKASALYMKALIFSVFDGDVIYSVAAFGKTPMEAGEWKATLPENRSDIWTTIKTAPEREQVIRFFAAGIVAENPQKFGLTSEKPISDLYRLTL
ncbi:hypothetical protein BH24ACI3_BH24ACI3_01740 [soil metagenome]